MNNKIFYIHNAIAIVFIIIIGRLVFLNSINQKQANNATPKKNKQIYNASITASKRGIIRDRTGKVIARDTPSYNIHIDKNHLSDYGISARSIAKEEGINVYKLSKKYAKNEIIRRYKKKVDLLLRSYLNLGEKDISDLRDKTKVDLVLREQINFTNKKQLESKMLEEKIKGITFIETQERIYPYGNSTAHVTGYVDILNDGKEGAEAVFNDFLKIHQKQKKTTDTNTKLPEVWLTLDMQIQKIVYEVIEQAYFRYQAENIIAIFTNPQTGEIIAMANYPSYEPQSKRGLTKHAANLAIQYLYDPGSVFKIVTAAAAFDNKKMHFSPSQVFYCHQGDFNNGRIHLTDHQPYYTLTFDEIIQYSSNIGIYLIARQLGKHNLYNYAHRFGFGQKTGIDLTSEQDGYLKKPREWTEHSLSRIPIGYEIMATPLQMAMAMGTIANGGLLMKPQICFKCVDSKGKSFKPFEPEIVRRVISKDSADKVKNALEKVVSDEGTAPLAKIPGYVVAGKTGTSRKLNRNLQTYSTNSHIVSFAGFLPKDNPTLLGLIVVDNPQTQNVKHYGGAIAAPIFSEIASKAIEILEVKRFISKNK